ncbi:hypothetical protein RSSM_06048 [Rhodopirellula sallentina SM41]|uniref:Uncharacterized protein n=1 Tax=Rhodopirellula sallentina SM41 TaxID=1263870 RepID=M5U939_9BACT|nr:hypothetical protein RSSM_06048 [Rhodopirellula sallentina SM41]
MIDVGDNAKVPNVFHTMEGCGIGGSPSEIRSKRESYPIPFPVAIAKTGRTLVWFARPGIWFA